MISLEDYLVFKYNDGSCKREVNIKKFNKYDWISWEFDCVKYKVIINKNTVSFSSYGDRNQFIKSLFTLDSDDKKKSFFRKNAILLNIALRHFDKVGQRSEDMINVTLQNKMGFVNMKGEELVPCKYGYVHDFQEGMAVVCLDNKRGFIDKTGKEIVPCKYGNVCDFQEGMAAVCLHDKWGFINKEGEEILSCKYDLVYNFGNFFAISDHGKIHFINKDGSPLYKTIIIESLNDLKKLPLNAPILDIKEKYGLVYENDCVWFDTIEERENFVQEVNLHSDFSFKREKVL